MCMSCSGNKKSSAKKMIFNSPKNVSNSPIRRSIVSGAGYGQPAVKIKFGAKK